MSEYVVMPASDWRRICDTTRSKTGTTDLFKSGEVAEAIEGIQTGGSTEDLLAARITNTLTHYENAEVSLIYKNAFADCESLVSISCPNVETIQKNAFYNAFALETAYFPNVKNFPMNGVFRACGKLKEFVAHKLNTARLDSEVFGGCTAITKIDLGRVGSITGYGVFMKCTSLKALILRQTDAICTLTSNTAFNNSSIASGTGYIYVPSALIEEYKAATNWSTYAAQFRALEDYTVDGTITGELDSTKI